MLKNRILLFCLITGLYAVQSQQIELSGNQIIIPGGGTNTPQFADGTLFLDTPVNGSTLQLFSIYNADNRDIDIDDIRLDSDQFSINSKIKKIKKNKSKSFDIYFEPTSTGVKTAILTITVKQRRTKKSYSYNLEGAAVEGAAYSGIMISQYYENVDDDFIEIINLSAKEIKKNKYVLAVYGPNDDLNKAPGKRNTIDVRRMRPGEVKVYKRFRLKGDEIIVISKSKGKKCFKDRIEILGKQGETWGKGLSLSKGGCASESAHTEFDPENWISLSLLEVDASVAEQNLFRGTYQGGPIVWKDAVWTSNALPDRTKTVVIEEAYSGNLGNLEACDLIVNSVLDFDNDSKKSVIVYGDLSVNGSFRLGDQESLVMYDDAAVISGVITKVEKSTFRNNAYDFTYWSSPIKKAVIDEVFKGVSPSRIYFFDQARTNTSDPDHPDFWLTWVPASGEMTSGMGYAAEGIKGSTGIHEISFQGIPNNGLIFVQVHHHDDENLNNDYNMIGNPYPSAIDIEGFFDANRNTIDPTVYLWTHATSVSESTGDFSFDDYATYNYTGGTGVGTGPVPTKNIGSAQGFFMRAILKGQVVFNNAMRLKDSNDQFFKNSTVKNVKNDEEKDRIWLNLTTDQGGFNQLLIGFLKEATEGIDPGYDALKFDGANKISFYSLIEDEKIAIQGLGPFESNKEIALGFDTKVSNREFSISIFKAEGILRDVKLILYDRALGISHDLKTSAYIFNQQMKGSFKNRFTLSFEKQVDVLADSAAKTDRLLVFNQGDVFTFTASKSIETIRFYTILGKMIHESHPRRTDFEITEPVSKKGELLLLQIEHADQSRSLKKVYKQ